MELSTPRRRKVFLLLCLLPLLAGCGASDVVQEKNHATICFSNEKDPSQLVFDSDESRTINPSKKVYLHALFHHLRCDGFDEVETRGLTVDVTNDDISVSTFMKITSPNKSQPGCTPVGFRDNEHVRTQSLAVLEEGEYAVKYSSNELTLKLPSDSPQCWTSDGKKYDGSSVP